MEAPEKIYACPLLLEDSESITRKISTEKNSLYRIEYTRTDAFIRKARKYFIKELPNFRSFMESGTAFIKNFESFIQGE